MNNILKKLFEEFKKETIVNKLIYINVALFLIPNIIKVFLFIIQIDIQPFINKFYLPANHATLIKQPWSLITYMFLHNGIFHLLFNMFLLKATEKIFLSHLHSKQLLNIYFLGGISGGLLFIISYNYLPILSVSYSEALILGSSASVLAILIAISTYIPQYIIAIPFIGMIKLKHIAITCVILDILSIPNGNIGGHIAHLGGALLGYTYIKQLKNENILKVSLIKFIKNITTIIFRKKNIKQNIRVKNKNDYEFNKNKRREQEKIDVILEKISNSGYESLSKDEKDSLFNASKK